MGMSVFFLMSRPSERGLELQNALGPVVAGGRLEVYSDIGGFEARMHRPKTPPALAIIWDPAREVLLALEAMRDLLTGLRILLVLPDGGAETVALAHRLRPAYVSYVDEGIAEIVAVLGRLTSAGGDGPGPATA